MKFKDLDANSKLSHLTPEELKNLFEDYYKGDLKISEIIKKYDLPITGSIEKHLPHVYTEHNCEYCGTQMLLKPNHRDRNANYAYCLDCKHEMNKYCGCDNCDAIRDKEKQEIYQKKRVIISEYCDKEQSKVVLFEKLTIEERIVLGTFIKHLASDDLEYIVPFGSVLKSKIYKDYLNDLVRNKILILHPYNSLDVLAFETNKFGQDVIKYDRKDVVWLLNIKKDDMSHPELLKYFALSDNFLDLDSSEISSFFKRIIIDESFEYLNYYSNIVLDLDLERSIQLDDTLGNLAEVFSISQIYNVIYGRVSYTGTYCSEHYLTPIHKFNLLLKNINSFKEKALADSWEVKHFNKPKYLNSSIITNFFFNNILKVGEQGYRLTLKELKDKMDA